MKRIVVVLSFLALAVLSANGAYAQSDPSQLANIIFGYQICKGQYALCAASTCTPTGNMITVNVTGGGTAQFPEASCTCPIFNGPSIADVFGGNMQGSCAAPGKGKVWSLYAPKTNIPQAINDWKRKPADTAVSFQLCGASANVGNTFTNCFSFACTVDKKRQNGVKTATCLCPLGENLDGKPVAANTAVLTPAGQCNSDICTQHPVGAPYAGAGDAPSQCLSTTSNSDSALFGLDR